MDIRFKGASLPYYERILNTAVSQEDTAETIIPDALPDVAELLMTDGQSLIRGKDVHRSGVSVSGISELNVLYRTEEGGISRLPVEIPFETEVSFNISEDASKIVASVNLTGCEARILNSRKLLLRAEVCITVSVWSPRTLRWAKKAETDGCQVEVKTECCTLRPVCGAEDNQPIPAGRPRAESLLSTRASLRWEEAEQVGRKLVVRGTAEITALYQTAEDEAAAAGFRLPWSAFLELPEGETGLGWELATSLTGCSGELTEGLGVFEEALAQAAEGSAQLDSAMSTVSSLGGELGSVYWELVDGMEEFADGIAEFDEEGIQSLAELAGPEYLNVIRGIKAARDAEHSFTNFSGIIDGQKGSVKFIIETEEVSKDT